MTQHEHRVLRDDRLLVMLQRLLAIESPELRPALGRATDLIAETFGAEKVDVFVYRPEFETLVALGTSNTPLGRQQRDLGLDRLPLANGGSAVGVFRTGESHLTGHADRDHEELRGIVEALGIRSVSSHPVAVGGQRRGALQVDSTVPEAFGDRDHEALGAVADWIGLVMHRAELAEALARQGRLQGRREAGEELARITRRQQEVVTCVAEGLSNAVIAQRLVLTEGTVANHVEAILRRLGLQSRTQIAVWAVERGLYRSDWEQDETDGPGMHDREE